jgi:hypothetical protein
VPHITEFTKAPEAKPTIKPVYGLLRLVSILIPHKRETPRVPGPESHQRDVRKHPYAPWPQKSDGLGVFSPAVPRDEDVDDLAVALEERVEVVRRGACHAKEEKEAVR